MTVNDKKQLIWHIGDPKTGTTSIQRALETKSVNAGNRTIDCFRPNGAYANAIAPAKALSKGKRKAIDQWFTKIKDWADTSEADYLIISAEAFWTVNPRLLKRMIKKHLAEYYETARIIAYTRPHASRFLSAFIQRTKTGGYKKTYNDFFDVIKKQKTLFYAPRAINWKNAFGENYTLRPFIPSELRKNDVVHDFFHEVLGDSDFSINKKIEENVAISTRALTGIRGLHQNFQSVVKPSRGQKSIARSLFHYHVPAEETSHKPPVLDPTSFEILYDTYLNDAQKLDEAFFSQPIMVDAFEKARTKAIGDPIDLSFEAHFTQDEVNKLDTLFTNIGQLCGEHNAVWNIYVNTLKDVAPLKSNESLILEKNQNLVDEMDGLLKEVAKILA